MAFEVYQNNDGVTVLTNGTTDVILKPDGSAIVFNAGSSFQLLTVPTSADLTAALASKSDTTHNHNTQYAAIDHTHNLSLPSGALNFFAMSAPPSGWLVCDGSAISRTVYASLFAAIGTTYGAGDGTTTFNIPNTLGRFLRHANTTANGIDPNRAIGSVQAQSVQQHKHFCDIVPGVTGAGTAYQTSLTRQSTAGAGTIYTGVNVYNSSNVLYPNETRPENIAFQLCIKI